MKAALCVIQAWAVKIMAALQARCKRLGSGNPAEFGQQCHVLQEPPVLEVYASTHCAISLDEASATLLEEASHLLRKWGRHVQGCDIASGIVTVVMSAGQRLVTSR